MPTTGEEEEEEEERRRLETRRPERRGYTWGGAEVGAALYAEHSTHCLYILYFIHASAPPAAEQRFMFPQKL